MEITKIFAEKTVSRLGAECEPYEVETYLNNAHIISLENEGEYTYIQCVENKLYKTKKKFALVAHNAAPGPNRPKPNAVPHS